MYELVNSIKMYIIVLELIFDISVRVRLLGNL